jgi:hypothetical protein
MLNPDWLQDSWALAPQWRRQQLGHRALFCPGIQFTDQPANAAGADLPWLGQLALLNQALESFN